MLSPRIRSDPGPQRTIGSPAELLLTVVQAEKGPRREGQAPLPPRRRADRQSSSAAVSQVQTLWAGTSAPPEMQVPRRDGSGQRCDWRRCRVRVARRCCSGCCSRQRQHPACAFWTLSRDAQGEGVRCLFLLLSNGAGMLDATGRRPSSRNTTGRRGHASARLMASVVSSPADIPCDGAGFGCTPHTRASSVREMPAPGRGPSAS